MGGARAGGGRGGERGVALLLSMLLLTILITLIAQLTWTAKVDEKLAANAKDELKMEFAARGALALVRAHLRADRADPETAAVDSLREPWADGLNQTIAIGDVAVELAVEDCESRLNVNLLARKQTKAHAQAILLRLVERLEIEEPDPVEVAQRIVDFVDTDDEGDYEDGAKNGTLLGPAELLAIEAIPDEVWFGGGDGDSEGDGGDGGGLLDLFGEAVEGEMRPGLMTFLTAWGTEQLNINTAPLDLLYAALPPEDAKGRQIDRDAAIEAIERFRTGGTEDDPPPEPVEGEAPPGEDFRSVDDLARIPGLGELFPKRQQGQGQGQGQDQGGDGDEQGRGEPLPKGMLTVTSQDFLVTVSATRAGLTRRFEALLRRGDEAFYLLMWRELER